MRVRNMSQKVCGRILLKFMGGLDVDSFWDNKTDRNADLRYGLIRVIGSLDHDVGGCVFMDGDKVWPVRCTWKQAAIPVDHGGEGGRRRDSAVLY